MPFLVIFIVIPFVELAVFASVSEHIGIWTTLLLAFVTAIIGGLLVKFQGLQTFHALQKALNQGQMPLSEIFDGFCLVAAGALLITPGFVTDTLGFALLIPAFRGFLKHCIRTHTSWSVSSHHAQWSGTDDDVIEGEYETVSENARDEKPRQIDEVKQT